MMGISFEIAESGVPDEDAYINLNDLDSSLRTLAAAKAEGASARRPEALTLGADTTVVVDGGILGKPANREDAARMLRTLSGAKHTVITAVALRCAEAGYCETASAHTAVFFRKLSEGEIEHYLSFPEYEDKAGSYAAQGKGMAFIDRIEGCFYNVMGLPVTATLNLFNEFTRKGTINVGE
jgi:septum formation protein